MTGRDSATARQVSDDRPTHLLTQERTPHVSAVPGEWGGAEHRPSPRSHQAQVHRSTARWARWCAGGAREYRGLPLASWYPILPGRSAPSSGLSTTIKGQTLGFSPTAWSVPGTAFLRPGPPSYSNPGGQCAAPCRPWPSALRKEPTEAGRVRVLPCARRGQRPLAPSPAALDPPSSALPWRRGLWPPERPGRGGPGAASDSLLAPGRGDPPSPRTAPHAPKARASPHLACAVWSGTARQRAARRPGRKRGLAPEATQTLPGSSRTLEDPALCDPRAGGAQLRSPDFVPKGPRRNRYVCPSLRDALTVTVPR